MPPSPSPPRRSGSSPRWPPPTSASRPRPTARSRPPPQAPADLGPVTRLLSPATRRASKKARSIASTRRSTTGRGKERCRPSWRGNFATPASKPRRKPEDTALRTGEAKGDASPRACRSRGGGERGGGHKAAAGRQAHRRADDGEPVVRSDARLSQQEPPGRGSRGPEGR